MTAPLRSGRLAGDGVVIQFDGAALGRTLQALKAADAALYKEVRSEIRKEGGKIKAAQKGAVMGLSVKGGGRRGSGAKTRFLHAARINVGNVESMSLSGSQTRRGLRATSLRAAAGNTLALEVREKPSARVRSAGVRIRMRSSAMPGDQAKLPKHMNYGRWRHPVFGSTADWVEQTATPSGWFDDTFNRMRPAAAFAIQQAIVNAFKSTQ